MTSEQSFRSFVSVFFLACGWAFTRYIDQASSAPIIEYDVKAITGEQGPTLDIELENLTSGITFTNLLLVLRLDNGRFAEGSPILHDQEPSWQGREPPVRSPQSGSFLIPEFHPGWKFRLKAAYSGSAERPTLHIHGSDKPVRLVQPSWETFFLRYEHHVVFFALAMYLLVLVWGAHLWGRLAGDRRGEAAEPPASRGEPPGE